MSSTKCLTLVAALTLLSSSSCKKEAPPPPPPNPARDAAQKFVDVIGGKWAALGATPKGTPEAEMDDLMFFLRTQLNVPGKVDEPSVWSDKYQHLPKLQDAATEEAEGPEAAELRECARAQQAADSDRELIAFLRGKKATPEVVDVIIGEGIKRGPKQQAAPMYTSTHVAADAPGPRFKFKRMATVTIRPPPGGPAGDKGVDTLQFEEMEVDPYYLSKGEAALQWFPSMGANGYDPTDLWCAMPALRRWAVANGFKLSVPAPRDAVP